MFSDIRVALRQLANARAFTVIALVTLTLGIGVNTAMFGILNGLLLRPAPFPDPQQLVRIFRTSPQSQSWPHSAPDLADEQAQTEVFAHFAYYTGAAISFVEPGRPPERIAGLAVSADFFPTIGVQPLLGRAFGADETRAGNDNVIVISYGLWQQRFGGDQNVIGKTLRVDGVNKRVIGVMPETFSYYLLWGKADALRPLVLTDEQRTSRGNHSLQAIARLKPDVALGQAQAELTALAARLAKDFPTTNAASGLRVVPLNQSAIEDPDRRLSFLLLGLASFVLLIACANLANLHLARTAGRMRDFAIRAALGASRLRLMREVLIESIILSIVGGAAALLLAKWITDGIAHQLVWGPGGPHPVFPIDYRVVGFTLLAALTTGVLFGLVPAWLASRTDVNSALKAQGRGMIGGRAQHRLRHTLIVGEVALALVLLSGAAVFVRALQRFGTRELGWQRDGLVTGSIALPDARYSNPQRRVFYSHLLDRLAAVPGVQAVAIASSVPTFGFNSSGDIVPEGRPLPTARQEPIAYQTAVTAGYFDALKISLRQGRLFPVDVRADSPAVAVINETMARQFWPGENPIGKRVGRADPEKPEWREVIGVVNDVEFPGDLGQPDTRLQMYVPLVQTPWDFLTVVLRTLSTAAALTPTLQQAVAEIDPDLPIYNIRTIAEALNHLESNFGLINRLLEGFAALGLVLAAVGLYGVITALVVQRLPEFGLRLALGAAPSDLLRMVLGNGLRLAIVGTVVGTIGAVFLGRLLIVVLPNLAEQNFPVLLGIGASVLTIAVIASLAPARRAMRVDPITALRAE
jgi:putative ABC transport system permease protein